MNDVELMNIQMDHVQRHHCDDPNCHLVKTLKEAQKEHQAIVMNQGETFDILEMGERSKSDIEMDNPAIHDVTSQGDYWDRKDSANYHEQQHDMIEEEED